MIPLLCATWFIITRFLYSYMSFLYVMWSRNLLKLHSPTSKKTITTKLGGNTYKYESVAYIHMTWVNHTNVIKATAPKVALMKNTNLNRSRVFDYMISWQMKRAYATFTKALKHQIWQKQTRKIIHLFLGSKFIWLMLHHKMN